MRGDMGRALAALCGARTRKTLAAEIAIITIAMGIVWIAAASFALLEPLA